MNILIPHQWLLEHVDTKVSPEEIQRLVSLSGPSIERIYEREGEPVYDIEVTTNRVDSMSVRGIAREVAVILTQAGKKARLRSDEEIAKRFAVKNGAAEKSRIKLALPQIINDPTLCKRVTCVALANVERTATPEWMAKRLRQIDGNVHDAVIDITNYITHDLGHPCHAFDYDRIMELGGMIIITTARKGKKFTTLDGETYTTVGGEMVFENERGEIIDLPGIKGTANTSINDETRNVLFWIENNDAKKIRFASMTHAIRTVAAQLNEKNVDPYLASQVLAEGTQLFQKLTHAQVASKVFDEFPGKKKFASVKVPLTKIEEYLGIELPLNTIGQILEDLGCEVDLKAKSLIVTPPTFRPDIEIAADVIEEVARIYGYHRLPSTLMPTAIPVIRPTETNFALENRIKHFLADIGWQEVYTYSMVSEQIALQSGLSLNEHLKLLNALTDDRVYLRRSLLPSLEEVIANNPQRKELRIFEITNTYTPRTGELPLEQLQLVLVSTNAYRRVKGEVEALLKQFFLKNVEVQPHKKALAGWAQSGELRVLPARGTETVALGTIGVLPSGHTAVVIDMPTLVTIAQTHPKYEALSRTSEIMEDLTFTLPDRVAIGPMIAVLKDLSPLIQNVELKDIYGQNYTLSFTYNDRSKNLTVDEIAPLRKKIVSEVQKKWGGELRGSLG